MLPKADLHIHTTCSDGKMSPEEAVELAAEKKLQCLSITDHDTCKAYHQAKGKAAELDIELIPGVEITSTLDDKEAHILAYNFDPDTNYLEDFLKSQKKARRERIKGIIETVQKNGVEVDFDEVWAEANGANIGRPHLAQVLIQKGYVSSHKEAFIRYLSNQKLGSIENTYPDYREVIEIIKNVGGASVVAHPGRMYSDAEIQQFIDAGIDGIECIHPSHNFKLQKKYTELCESESLLMTGGSDSHDHIETGYTNVGVVTIAYKYVERLLRMTEQRKNITEIKH
ncbi:MAG TPA: PHP domain-containing protein [Balneolaceae bacterium]|nr:phosphatase [Balneola sp.]HBQ60253.1 PHP domain-containing protein [Balneolaceae bacterium]|tara:strand:- start:23889 stop:24740 length:852 start_codon:yes stop_codon:yes gene_type:complete